jgi:hypothetical protein
MVFAKPLRAKAANVFTLYSQRTTYADMQLFLANSTAFALGPRLIVLTMHLKQAITLVVKLLLGMTKLFVMLKKNAQEILNIVPQMSTKL